MNPREYLESVGVIKLQNAARMAGLRFKNGAPGFDKAGIIDKLERMPSVMRATIAVLQKMGESASVDIPAPKAGSLLADMADEEFSETPTRTPVAQTVSPSDPAPVLDAGLIRRINGIDDRVTRIESNYATRENVVTMGNAVKAQIHEFGDRIAKMEENRPVHIHIPERKTIEIPANGAHKLFAKLVTYLHVNRRVVLVGQAGTGKSIAVKNAAEALGVPFYLLPPVTMSHELIGHRDAQGCFHSTALTEAYTKGGLCLLDEADASLPDALLCANPILDGNGFATLGDGIMHTQHPDFYAVFNMNTDGNGGTMQYAGRNRLDGATLARFGVRIDWGIDPAIEERMAQGQTGWLNAVRDIRRFMIERDIVDVNATPRHLKTGAMLLHAGCTREDVLTDCLKSGALAQAWDDVLRLRPVSRFLAGE